MNIPLRNRIITIVSLIISIICIAVVIFVLVKYFQVLGEYESLKNSLSLQYGICTDFTCSY